MAVTGDQPRLSASASQNATSCSSRASMEELRNRVVWCYDADRSRGARALGRGPPARHGDPVGGYAVCKDLGSDRNRMIVMLLAAAQLRLERTPAGCPPRTPALPPKPTPVAQLQWQKSQMAQTRWRWLKFVRKRQQRPTLPNSGATSSRHGNPEPTFGGAISSRPDGPDETV
jgi:hypothetical protein